MAPPRKKALPKPLPESFILTDMEKKEWRLGKIIGQGGFGLIYLASQDVDRVVPADTKFVIKVEYQENGPLFSELKFYQRAAKPESMEKWKRSSKLDFLGIPTYWGSGLAEYNDLRYRFMVMDRLGSDLQKICEHNGGRLKKPTVLQLGQGLVTVLEYIHEKEYVHADIKAANLMLGYTNPGQVYLADYGLSYRYCPDGVHKEYKENPKKGHNGTIEYTSLDAHNGTAPSRRGDLQILGFCLLHWLCGSLPWDNVLNNPTRVQEAKARLMDNLPDSVKQLSVSGASTDEVAEFLLYVKGLGYQEKPDYQLLKVVLASVVTGRLDLSMPHGPARESTTKVQDPPTREKSANNTTASQPTSDKKTGSQRAGRARGSSKAKAAPTKVEDKQEDEERKPVPARHTRKPPLSKTQAEQKEDGALPASGRSLRPRSVVTYAEDFSEDEMEAEGEETEEESEEEAEARPTPIPACYLRGPPIGPRPQPKQRTKSKWTGRKTEDLTVTSERQEGRLRPQRRKHILTNQRHMEYCERLDERLLHHRADNSHGQWQDSDLCYEDRDRFGTPEGSALRGTEQEAGPTQGNGIFSWFVIVGVCLFLGLLLEFAKVHLNPFERAIKK